MGAEKLYVVTRRDLPPGVQVAQIVHAAVEIATEKDLWPDLPVVVVTVADERELCDLSTWLSHQLAEAFVVLEPDLDHELTAISVLHGGWGRLGDLPLLYSEENVKEPEKETKK